jgi:hypothetical protein
LYDLPAGTPMSSSQSTPKFRKDFNNDDDDDGDVVVD